MDKVSRAWGYARVSTEKQATEGYSLPEQRLAIEAECARRGWVLLGIRADEGVSGKRGADRVEWRKVLDDCRSGAADAVIVTKIDRFSRSASDMIARTDELIDLGVAFVSIGEAMDLSTPAGRFMRTIYAGVAEQERETLAARSAMGLRGKARAGLWPGGPAPFGYRVNEGRLEVEPAEAALLRRIARMAVDDGMTTGEIARVLSAEGVTGRNGGEMHHQAVRRLLTSTALVGEAAFGKVPASGKSHVHGTRTNGKGVPVWGGEIRLRVDEPVLTPGDFEALQRALGSRAHGPRRQYRTFALTGMLRCVCGSPMQGATIQGVPRYRCREARWHANLDRVKCAMPVLDAATLEQRVWDKLWPVLGNPSLLQRAVKAALAEAGTSAQTAAEDLAAARSALENATDSLSRGLTAAIRAGAPPEVIEETVRTANADQAALADRVARLERIVANGGAPADQHLAALCKAARAMAGKAPTPKRLREVLALVGGSAVVGEMTKQPSLRVTAEVDAAALARVVGESVGTDSGKWSQGTVAPSGIRQVTRLLIAA